MDPATKDTEATLGGPPSAVLAAVRRVLGPLVRVLIHFGITFPTLSGLLKTVYVEVAERDFALPGKPMTDSRVTLLTGVHRKDVSRMRAPGEAAADAAPVSPSLGAQVLGAWLALAGYRAADGGPRPLPRAGEGSFEALVEGISKDIRPRALLDELLHAKLVRERADGLLELVVSAHLPRGDLDKTAYYFGRNLADHVAAAGANLTGGAPRHLERAMFHDGLSQASVEALRAEAERRGMELLVHLNALATELAERDARAGTGGHRFTTGLYLYDRPEESGGTGA
ncbi:DUF6502 family protein [Azospirillum sp.]|uniref:DUF6502 family protein n=1 Tax=Azospirillum sp. TaxID=34012 RepID=UPI002D6A0B12|nr:DUF6502 family protein [Azospirillum sp.]HYD70699.1 DUF6502 family protein [Azospirillum sp.]